MCRHSAKCWRRAYSEYYIKVQKYDVPPKRDIVFLAGFATLDMMPKKGIFCENMPTSQCENNLCPFMQGKSELDCKEFQFEEKRQSYLKNRQNNAKYQNRSLRADIPKEIRKQVAIDHRYKCVYCGLAHGQYRENGNKVKCVVDHFIPLAQGGHPTAPSNLVLACDKCNSDKGADIWQKGCRKNVLQTGFTEMA